MTRLTNVRCNGIKSGYWSTAKKDELLQRLGKYEDTGMEPGEIRANRLHSVEGQKLPVASNIVKEIGLSAALGQLAEECAELAKAALKIQRIVDGKNPTPIPMEEAKRNLVEEACDVEVCLAVLSQSGIKTFSPEIYANKVRRWERRITEKAWVPFLGGESCDKGRDTD